MSDEPQARIGIALVVATAMALLAIVVSENVLFVLIEVQERAELFASLIANCLNGGGIQVAGDIFDCKPRKL